MNKQTGLSIREFCAEDEEIILALNQQSVAVLSPMDAQRFQALRENCCVLWIAELEQQPVGFLLAFSESSKYDSPNYQWFNQRYNNFVYIDRVVVSNAIRSKGVGSEFYRHLQAWAKLQHKPRLCAEIDVVPPNEGSLKFHQRQGFVEAGQQVYGNPEKKVALMVKNL